MKNKTVKVSADFKADTQLEINVFGKGLPSRPFFTPEHEGKRRLDYRPESLDAAWNAGVKTYYWLFGSETFHNVSLLNLGEDDSDSLIEGVFTSHKKYKAGSLRKIREVRLSSSNEKVDEAFMARFYGFYSEVRENLKDISCQALTHIAFAVQDPLEVEELVRFFREHNLLKEEVTPYRDLVYSLESLKRAVDSVEDFNLDVLFWTWILVKRGASRFALDEPFEPLPEKPTWVEEEAWELYQKTRPWEAAEVLNNVVKDVIRHAKGRVIVCLARDFLWLYALLVERGVPAYLAVCSRLNIGDDQTSTVIWKELQDKGVLLQDCLFVDSQGRGSIYDWMRTEFNLPADNFAFLYSCSKEYKGICQNRLTREEVIDKIEHRLIHPVGRSHGWVHHEGLGWQPVWQTRELDQYSVRCIQQVRALTCLHMGVSEAWNSCMGHTAYERTMGLTLAKDEFPEVYIRVTQEAWETIQKEGYKTLRETGYSMGLDNPGSRDQYEQRAFHSIVNPLYGYRDDFKGWACYGKVVLRLKSDYKKFCTSTPGDSLDHQFEGSDVLPLALSAKNPRWKNQEVQIHTFLPPQAFEVLAH